MESKKQLRQTYKSFKLSCPDLLSSDNVPSIKHTRVHYQKQGITPRRTTTDRSTGKLSFFRPPIPDHTPLRPFTSYQTPPTRIRSVQNHIPYFSSTPIRGNPHPSIPQPQNSRYLLPSRKRKLETRRQRNQKNYNNTPQPGFPRYLKNTWQQ